MLAHLFSRPMWQKNLFAFLCGIGAGYFLGPSANIFKPMGDLYLNLLRMIVLPLIFFSLSSSVARLSALKNIKNLFLRTFFWFLFTSFLAVLVGIFFGHLIGPGFGLKDLPLGQIVESSPSSPWQMFLGMVPTNPFLAFSEANIIQILFIAALVGAALGASGDKLGTLKMFLNEGSELIFHITRWILKLTPLGTFALIAWVVGHYGFISLLPLIKFIIAMYAACLALIGVYAVLAKAHGLGLKHYFRHLFPAQQMAFATCSSMAVMPLSLATAKKAGVAPDYANFALPLAATIKMDGCGAIYPTIAAIFIAQYFGLELTISHYVLIGVTAIFGAIGTAGVPGTSIVMLSLSLKAAGLPLEGITYIVAIDRIIDMIRTTTNVSGQITVSLLVAKEEGILDQKLFESKIATQSIEEINSAERA